MDKGMHDLLTSQAAAVEERLRKSLGAAVFDTWLKTLSVGGFKDGILTLFLPTNFFCSYIARNFSEEITQAWRNENQAVVSVKFEVGSPAFSAPAEKRRKCPGSLRPRRRPWCRLKRKKTLCPRLWIRALRLITLSSGRPMNLPMPLPGGWPNPTACRLIRCICIPAPGWEKRI